MDPLDQTVIDTDPGEIFDTTCWYCDRPFETRDPDQGLCYACEPLRDEALHAAALRFTITRRQTDTDDDVTIFAENVAEFLR